MESPNELHSDCQNIDRALLDVTGCCNYLHDLDPIHYSPNFDSFQYLPNTRVSIGEGHYVLHPILASHPRNVPVITCEHSSNLLPPGYEWSEKDKYFSQRHNAVDIGIWLVVMEMYKILKLPTILARYSRLFVDLNRCLSCPTLILDNCNGIPLEMNSQERVTQEIEKRLTLWHNYRFSVDELMKDYSARLIISMHSFTPIFCGERRTVEIGILYDCQFVDMQIVNWLHKALTDYSYEVRHNEPYAGDRGTRTDSPPAKSCALQYGVSFILFEIRQDLTTNTEWRELFVSRLCPLIQLVSCA